MVTVETVTDAERVQVVAELRDRVGELPLAELRDAMQGDDDVRRLAERAAELQDRPPLILAIREVGDRGL